MLKILRTLRRRPPKSSFEVLQGMLPRRVFKQILAATDDKRLLFTEAAIQLKIEEPELMKQIANRLEIPYLESFAPLNRETEFGSTARSMLSVGAALVAVEGGLPGIACIDPASCDTLPDRIQRLPCFLATWGAISGEKSAVIRDDAGGGEVAQGLLALLITDCEGFGASRIELDWSGASPVYRFKTADGRAGSGLISPAAAPALMKYFESGLQMGTKRVEVSTGGNRTLFFERIDGCRAVQVEWESGPAAESGEAPFMTPLFTNPSVRQLSRGALEKRAGRVLVIDDNGTFVRVLERFLERLDIEVVHRCDGAAALSEIGSIAPDLLICDLHMPALGGADVLKLLRERRETEDLPAIMLTSDTDPETRIRVLNGGADAFVTKDEDPRILCAHVRRMLSRRSLSRKAA